MKEFYKVDEHVEPAPNVVLEEVDQALLIPKPIEALRSFITSYLNDDGEDFEDILTRCEKKDEVTRVANW